VQWIFHTANGGAQIETLIFNTLTSAITHERGSPRVLNWKRAITDLGEPTVVKTDLVDRFLVRWHGITAELPDEVALAGGADLQNIRLADLQVLADLSLGEGRWQKMIVLGHGERVEGTTVHYAYFNPLFNATLSKETRTQVKGLLRATRHSLAWHQAMAVRDLVDEDLQGTRIWEEIDEIDQLTRGFAPLWLLRERMRELKALRNLISEQCTNALSFTGEQDARIYKEPLASEALSDLTERNEYSLKELDEAIKDLRERVGRVRGMRQTPAYRDRIKNEIDRLQATALSSTVTHGATRENARLMATRVSALCANARGYLERGNIEDALNRWLELCDILSKKPTP
jgi:hypothetical protein